MKKRNLFAELKQGLEELAVERKGKTTLSSTVVPMAGPVEVPVAQIKAVRESLHLSQAVMARRPLGCPFGIDINVCISPRIRYH
jgi:putative transcriptional regulator